MMGQKLRWYQIAGLVLAGLSSFAFAAYWNMASGNEADDLVQPVVRSRPTYDRVATSPVSAQASPDTQAAPGANPLQMNARSEHTSGQVAHNPFGSLNLLAGAELATGRHSGSVVRTPVSTQVRKPKVEAPPPHS